jgi:hypothetical protein
MKIWTVSYTRVNKILDSYPEEGVCNSVAAFSSKENAISFLVETQESIMFSWDQPEVQDNVELNETVIYSNEQEVVHLLEIKEHDL